MPRPKLYNFNLRLLRSGKSVEAAFGPSFAIGEPRQLEERPWPSVEGARLFLGQIYNNPPGWVSFLESGSADLPGGLFASGAGAILFVPCNGQTVALCFGHIHLALNEDAFVRQFGLKVVLNSVNRESLRSLDTATPDSVTMQKRVQASKDTDLQAFGVDMYRDLARVAAGTPKDKGFAEFAAGKDSLKIVAKDKPDEVKALCERVIAMYQQDTYKTDFSWVDQMRQVHEKDTLDALDQQLFEAIEKMRQGDHAELHMSPPEIVNYTEGNQLHYNGFGSGGEDFASLSIDDYVSELNRLDFEGDVIELKAKHKISAKSDIDGTFDQNWKIYDCFVFEASLGDGDDKEDFILFAGSWFRVDKDFKAEIEAAFNEVEAVTVIGPTTCKNERELIADVDGSRADLLNLDQTKINPKGVRYGNLEPCDFLSANKEFIHLKDGHSSGSISHLWSQGVVSAEAFLFDRDFRKKLRSKTKTESDKKDSSVAFETLLPLSTQRPVRSDYKVVYGIMRKPYKDGSLDLPFFSKVSFLTAIRRLNEFQIPVAIELIEKPAADNDAEAD